MTITGYLKRILTIAMFGHGLQTNAQISFYTDENISFPDISVRIGQDVSFPDVRIKIGEDIFYEDFTVGITSQKSRADFLILNSRILADKTVRVGPNVSFPDISIRAGKDVSMPDVGIEIRKSGSVDYLVYTEKSFMSLNDLIVALLPAINKHVNYKLKNVPNFIQGNSRPGNGYSGSSNSDSYSDVIYMLRGASVIAQDAERTFLGTISGEYNSNSIFNEVGTYGSPVSTYSIWNVIGIYGSSISVYSPFNQSGGLSPMIIKGGKIIGYLTINNTISGGISPLALKSIKNRF